MNQMFYFCLYIGLIFPLYGLIADLIYYDKKDGLKHFYNALFLTAGFVMMGLLFQFMY